MKKIKTITITKTAVMLALLLAVQALTASFGQLVTGSLVNCVLAASALLAGPIPGLIVAVISPFGAFFLGIGPQLLPIVPAIALGNMVFVLLISLFSKKEMPVVCIAAASGAKALTLYLVVVKLLCSVLELKEAQIAKFSAMFSWPQLFSALIGCTLAILISKRIGKK